MSKTDYYGKPWFNGRDWIVSKKNHYGLTLERHKFGTEKEANEFYNNHTEQPKVKVSLGGSENK